MADHDQSLYTLRYNQITQNLEGFGGGSPQWTLVTLNNVDPTQVPVTRTISTTAPLTGGGNLSADRTLSIPAATHLVDGYLLSSDWNVFNGKQAAGAYITALTGDVSAVGPGSAVSTLATVNSNVGSFTNANITVDAKGRVTAASNGSGGSSGAVAQVRYVKDTSVDTVSSATFVDTTLTKTITPTNSSHVVKITITTPIYTNTGAPQPALGLSRNGTDLIPQYGWFLGVLGASETYTVFTATYFDEPASTSLLTYTVRARNDSGGADSFDIGNSVFAGGASRILALEEIIAS